MSNRRKIRNHDEPEDRSDIRRNAVAILMAAYYEDEAAMGRLIPGPDDPEALANTIAVLARTAADFLHAASDFDPEQAGGMLLDRMDAAGRGLL